MIFLIFGEQMEMIWIGMLTSVASTPKGVEGSLSVASLPLFLMERLGIGHSPIQALIFISVPIAIYKATFLFLSRYLTQVLAIRVSKNLRERYFAHLQSLPMQFFHGHHIGSLASRVTGDSSQIALSINSLIRNCVTTPFQLITTIGICVYLSWKLTFVLVIGLPLVLIPLNLLTKKVKSTMRLLQKDQESFSSLLLDFLSGIQTIKIFSMELFSFKKYQHQNDKMASLEKKTAKYDLMTRPILHTVTTLCLASVILVGLHVFQMSIPDLIAFCGLLHVTYDPIKKFAEENASIQKGVVAAERMNDILSLKPLIEDAKEALTLTNFNDSIEFIDVWFRYEEGWIIKDLSFKVKKGETIAIVGATGSGKSTILQLIPRLYDVEKGIILIDGIPLTKIAQQSIRNLIAFVSQKPFLFYDTIEGNINYGRPLEKEKIEQAAKRAYADEFIDKLSRGYQTHLSETGKNLSGGQQQRLAIARALAKEAPILILDEATSSLDSLSEERVKQAISDLHGEVTQIIVAHRLSTIEHADRIIFLEQGKKIAEGPHKFLYETCPQFRVMWDLSFGKKEYEEEGLKEGPSILPATS